MEYKSNKYPIKFDLNNEEVKSEFKHGARGGGATSKVGGGGTNKKGHFVEKKGTFKGKSQSENIQFLDIGIYPII